MPGGPHTSSRPNYTWGTLGINNCGGPIHQFPLRYWGNLLCAYWSPWPTFFPIRFRNGTVWTSQKVLFQLFFILQLGFCAIFTRVSDRARVSEQGPCLCLHEYGALTFSPFNWAKCTSYSVGWWKICGLSTKCYSCCSQAQRPTRFHIRCSIF